MKNHKVRDNTEHSPTPIQTQSRGKVHANHLPKDYFWGKHAHRHTEQQKLSCSPNSIVLKFKNFYWLTHVGTVLEGTNLSWIDKRPTYKHYERDIKHYLILCNLCPYQVCICHQNGKLMFVILFFLNILNFFILLLFPGYLNLGPEKKSVQAWQGTLSGGPGDKGDQWGCSGLSHSSGGCCRQTIRSLRRAAGWEERRHKETEAAAALAEFPIYY